MRRIIPIAWIVCLVLLAFNSAGAADAVKLLGDKPKAAKAEKPSAAKAKDAQPKPAAAAAKKDKATKKEQSAVKIRRKSRPGWWLTIKGNYPEGPTSAGVFGDLKPSLRTITDRIDQAAEDQDVDALVLSIEDLELGQGKIHEARAAIARFRKHGKPGNPMPSSPPPVPGSTWWPSPATRCSCAVGMLMLPGSARK